MHKKSYLIVIIVILMFPSCTTDLFGSLLFRTVEDPVDAELSVDSLSEENTIYVKWDKDDASDKYYLMRSLDNEELSFECVYEGNNTSFIDCKLPDFKKYVYRLDKLRGEKLFKGTKLGYGFSSMVRKDSLEPNDSLETATFLEYDLQCNLPCVRFESNSMIKKLDEDWFYIKLPPNRMAELIVSEKGLNHDSMDPASKLMILFLGESPKEILQAKPIQTSNTTNLEKKVIFKIYPNETNLFGTGSFITSLEYNISLYSISKIQ